MEKEERKSLRRIGQVALDEGLEVAFDLARELGYTWQWKLNGWNFRREENPGGYLIAHRKYGDTILVSSCELVERL
jgi:hypothetical protein